MISVRVDDREIMNAFRRMERKLGSMRPLMVNVGEELTESTKRRFGTQTDPEGRRWKPLHPGTVAAKKSDRILYRRGHLSEGIHYRAATNSVKIGSGRVYAAIHQFGGKTGAHVIKPKRKKALAWPGGRHPVKSVRHPGSKIPARPFLGVSAEDKTRILQIAEHFLGQ